MAAMNQRQLLVAQPSQAGIIELRKVNISGEQTAKPALVVGFLLLVHALYKIRVEDSYGHAILLYALIVVINRRIWLGRGIF
jgi:hypothetical protein